MHLRANRERDRLSGRDRALSQIRRKTQRLAVMPGARGSGQLRSIRRDRLQFERPLTAQQDANQLGPKQKAQTVGQSLDHCRNVWRSVERMRHVGQNLRAPVLFPGSLAQPRRFQQAAQLPGQDRRFGGNIFIKEIVVGIVQKCNRANYFVQTPRAEPPEASALQIRSPREKQWTSRDSRKPCAAAAPPPPLPRSGRGAAGGPRNAQRVSQLPAPPAILPQSHNARNTRPRLGKNPGSPGRTIESANPNQNDRSFRGNAKQKPLESVIGPWDKTVFRGNDRTTRNAKCRSDNGGKGS